MKRTFTIILIFSISICLNACSFSKVEYGTTSAIEESELLFFNGENEPLVVEEVLSDSDVKKLNDICSKYGATGVAVALINNNSLGAFYSYGFAKKSEGVSVCTDTKYRVASLSKLVTDIIFLELVDSGLVELHENIENYLGYNVRNPYYPDKIITPHMLMTHTSSIVDSQSFLQSRLSNSNVEMYELLSDISSYSSNAPGNSYIYSNFGIAIIGAICEKVTGKCFDDIAQELIFEPLGIDAGFVASSIKDKDLIGELYGYGGMTAQEQLNTAFSSMLGQTHHIVQGNLTISAKDYAQILCLLLNDGKDISGNSIISSETVEKILLPRISTFNGWVGYGFKIQENVIAGEKVYVHTGSNYGMFSSFVFSENGTGVVVLTSGANGSKDDKTEIYNICLEIIQYLMS